LTVISFQYMAMMHSSPARGPSGPYTG